LAAPVINAPTGYSDCNYGGYCTVPQIVTADMTYNPAKGISTSAFYRSPQPITVTTTNLTVSTDTTITNGEYKCQFEAKQAAAGAYTVLTNDGTVTGLTVTNYDVVTGCSAVITKTLRGGSTAVNVQLTILKASDNSVVSTQVDTYNMRAGALL
jgi:hypothetical protein